MLDDRDLDFPQEPAAEPPRRSGRGSFLAMAGILGVIILLALVGIAVYTLIILPGQRAPAESISVQLTGTALAQSLQITNTPSRTATRTATSTRTPRPPTATNTPVTPLFTNTSGPSPNPATQTVAALLTQAALAQTQAATSGGPSGTPGSVTPTLTASALPQSGFGDGSGAPLLLAAAAMLILVIIAVRRLRSAV